MLVIATRTAIGALLVAAAVCDLSTLRIPNPIPLALAAVFCVTAMTGVQGTLPPHLMSVGIAGIVSGALFFGHCWGGGGDTKLSAAFALFLTPRELGRFALITALAGGILALVILLARRVAAAQWNQRPDMPYGLALAAGGLDWVFLH